MCVSLCNRKKECLVAFEVLTAVSMKIAVFWVVAPCSLVEVFRAIALMMEAARTSETLVNFYQTTRCYNPEDSNLQGVLSLKTSEQSQFYAVIEF
jgi:hypothetical protein